ncbi:hypothetical protein WJX74_006046 [Apatococcus lobatus]|uniref:Uncharacterized protein n=1 Tax=Apatococcus lobatus TaxID=904363 RepID=A0AAW1SAL5_9CHLO
MPWCAADRGFAVAGSLAAGIGFICNCIGSCSAIECSAPYQYRSKQCWPNIVNCAGSSIAVGLAIAAFILPLSRWARDHRQARLTGQQASSTDLALRKKHGPTGAALSAQAV